MQVQASLVLAAPPLPCPAQPQVGQLAAARSAARMLPTLARSREKPLADEAARPHPKLQRASACARPTRQESRGEEGGPAEGEAWLTSPGPERWIRRPIGSKCSAAPTRPYPCPRSRPASPTAAVGRARARAGKERRRSGAEGQGVRSSLAPLAPHIAPRARRPAGHLPRWRSRRAPRRSGCVGSAPRSRTRSPLPALHRALARRTPRPALTPVQRGWPEVTAQILGKEQACKCEQV